jgi:hypothetical protein
LASGEPVGIDRIPVAGPGPLQVRSITRFGLQFEDHLHYPFPQPGAMRCR